MGGRRPVSLAKVLGPHRDASAERELQSALHDQDPERVARISSALAEKAVLQTEVQAYFTPFLPFIKKQLSHPEPIDSIERRRIVRSEWARIKREQGLEVREPVSDAVVQAVMNFLRRRGR